jgi:hypothetical protein
VSALGKTILSLCDIGEGCLMIQRKLLFSIAHRLKLTHAQASTYTTSLGVWIFD